MVDSASPLRRPSGWWRRIALAVLFALQGAITLAPLIEPGEQGRIGTHAEEQGAQHKYQHDETTCAVCAVRSLHSSPVQGCPPFASDTQQNIAALEAPVGPVREVVFTALPRAPPRLS